MGSRNWPAVQGASADERWARGVGGRVGLVVAGAVIPVEFALRIPTPDPSTTLLITCLPTIVAGWLGGRLVGAWALRARTTRTWIALVLRLGLLAILIGAPIVAVEIAIVGVISDVTTGLIPVGLSIPNAILATVVLTALGTTFVGPFAALGTIPAAAIWAAVMRAKLRRHRAP
jgi:hypothetical protein